MIILEITTGEQSQQRQQMNAEGVVICTYIRADNGVEVDGIDYSYKSQFPELPEVEVVESGSL